MSAWATAVARGGYSDFLVSVAGAVFEPEGPDVWADPFEPPQPVKLEKTTARTTNNAKLLKIFFIKLPFSK